MPLIWLLLPLLGGCSDDAPSYRYTLEGLIQYEDKEYDSSGFTQNTGLKPVRHAHLQVVSASGFVLAEGHTDASGQYSLSVASENDVKLRILARTHGQAIAVELLTPYNGLLAATRDFSPSNGTINLDVDITTANPVAGAFNILDIMQYAGEFTYSLSNTYPPPLQLYWEPNNPVGTFYCSPQLCPNQSGIYILGGNYYGDTDEYDDDVLWHEYGHFLEYSLAILDAKGGTHYLDDTDQDLRLSWSEGWGSFISGAIKAWLRAQYGSQALSLASTEPPSLYVDTEAGMAKISYDFALALPVTNYAGLSVDPLYASSEAAVAKVLWGTHSAHGMQSIWDVAAQHLSALDSESPSNLENFWAGWLALPIANATSIEAMRQILEERAIFYREDGYESPDDGLLANANTISFNTPTTHSFYRGDLSLDKDLFSFDASADTSYLIETSLLHNGADTQLRLYDATGNPVLDGGGNPIENDNKNGADYYPQSLTSTQYLNNGSYLASQIKFIPSLSGRYILEVGHPEALPLSAGRLGDYTLSVKDRYFYLSSGSGLYIATLTGGADTNFSADFSYVSARDSGSFQYVLYDSASGAALSAPFAITSLDPASLETAIRVSGSTTLPASGTAFELRIQLLDSASQVVEEKTLKSYISS